MIRNDSSITIERSGDFDENTFGIDTEDVSLILEIIRNKLYSNKLGSFIREISSNAYDAMVELAINNGGSELDVRNKCIDYTLPTDTNNSTFTIRDYGTGMSDDKIRNIYTKVGKSTRSVSNKFVGMMGIGRLVGFCVTDSFNVTSYLDGTRTEYLCYIDETKCGKIATLSQSNTTEPNGIAISINVPREMWRDLCYELRRFIYGVDDVQFNVTNINDINIPYVYDTSEYFKPPVKYFEGTNWICYKCKDSLSFSYIKMGIVKYPIDHTHKFLKYNHIIFNVPIGSITINASREAVEYTKETTAFINQLVDVAYNEAYQIIQDNVNKCKDLVDVAAYYKSVCKIIDCDSDINIKYTEPNTKLTVTVPRLFGHFNTISKYTPIIPSTAVPDGNGYLDPEIVGERDPVTGKLKYREIEQGKQQFEACMYHMSSDYRRTNEYRSMGFNWENISNSYYTITNQNDLKKAPDIKRVRTIAPGRYYAFTELGLNHFIQVFGFNPTLYMKKWEDVIPTEPTKKTKTAQVYESVIFKYSAATNKVTYTEINTKDPYTEWDGIIIPTHHGEMICNNLSVCDVEKLVRVICEQLKTDAKIYYVPNRLFTKILKSNSKLLTIDNYVQTFVTNNTHILQAIADNIPTFTFGISNIETNKQIIDKLNEISNGDIHEDLKNIIRSTIQEIEHSILIVTTDSSNTYNKNFLLDTINTAFRVSQFKSREDRYKDVLTSFSTKYPLVSNISKYISVNTISECLISNINHINEYIHAVNDYRKVKQTLEQS